MCKPITKAFLDFAPELVVEILSPATALKDRHTKFSIYQEQKIKYYLIVDTDSQSVEVYSISADELYQRMPFDVKQPFSFQFIE